MTADETHCAECGYPLEWQDRSDDDTTASDAHMVRRPGEADPGNETRSLSTSPPPHAPSEQPPGPSVRCPACGAANPAGRTLCERCGEGLGGSAVDADAHRVDGASWWRGRSAWAALLAIIVLAGATVGWVFLRSGPDGGARAGTGGEPAAEATSAAPAAPPEVVLEPGDRGDEVRQWQRTLQAAGFQLQADGVFGPQTELATGRFQGSIGEEPTGRVTTRTLRVGQRVDALRRIQIFLAKDGELVGAGKRVDEAQLAHGVVEALIAPPLQAERDRGLSTAIPPGVELERVVVRDGTATVALHGFAADPKPLSLERRRDQVVRTLTELPSVDHVVLQLPDDEATAFSNAGVPLRAAGGVDG